MKNKIYKSLPNFLQGLAISFFNYIAYKYRYGSKYKKYLNLFKENRNMSLDELYRIQKEKFYLFLNLAIKKSPFYKDYDLVALEQIGQLPIIGKEDIRQNIDQVYTISKAEGIVSKTGGTTGKSLKVLYTSENMQERFAMLDDFRSRFGYELGKKTAWFSGKDLLSQSDLKKHRFWKMDPIYKVRYYSTFHIKETSLKYYVEDLIKFKPEFFVGFPSTMLDIAKYGKDHGYDFPKNTIKAIFPTAETVTKDMRAAIERFFKTKMYDQYASSEGAPFIIECIKGNLHIELQSGVFEVLDELDRPTSSGRLVVTSFTTEGTPLIRYDIGDSITLDDPNKVCGCGNNNPMALEILGRIDDYIYSKETGKINLGNVSNTLKDTIGIRNFQVVQDSLDVLDIYLIVDQETFTSKIEKTFLQNWRDRAGGKIDLRLHYVEEIPVESSGKFRIVKNNIKHLINV